MAEMRRLIQEAISDERLLNIINAIATKAELGDLAAAKVLLPYLVGKPTAGRDPDRVDEEEWENRKRRPDGPEMQETVNRVEFGVANAIGVGHDVMHQQMVEEQLTEETAGATGRAKRHADDVKVQAGSARGQAKYVEALTKEEVSREEPLTPSPLSTGARGEWDPEWGPPVDVLDEVLREEWRRRHARNGRLTVNGNGKHKKGKGRRH
jgi:hypothetical protein